jgi:membrane-associated phospholipid phosphatase
MYVHPSRANSDKSKLSSVQTAEQPEESNKTSTTKYIVGFIVGALIFIPTLIVAHAHHLSGFQERIFYDLNNLSNSYKTPALWTTEGLGAGYGIAACVLVPLVFKRFRLAWRFLFTVGGAGAVMEIAKHVAKEPRPAVLLDGRLHERAIETGLNSFPSGHETMATAMALTLWLILPRKWRWLSIVWIIIVGVSRIYLGDHTPYDVLGGFAIGLMAVCFIQLLPPRIAKFAHLSSGAALTKKGW